MTKQRGFTLIELMIVVVIISILAAIAIPSYTAYLDRAACEDGKSLLMRAAADAERHRAQNRGSYVGFVDLPQATNQFAIAAANITAAGYTLTATAEGRLNGTLTLTAANVRAGTDGLEGQCNW
ncbi:type IV pilin protein [Pseudomonas sp. NPDC077382]